MPLIAQLLLVFLALFSPPAAAVENPHWDETAELCAVEAAGFYQFDVDILRAIAVIEGGQPGLVMVNTNRTRDYSLMQVNSRWLRDPRLQGLTEKDLRDDVCVNIWVASWIYAHELKRAKGDIYRAAGYYHSSTKRHYERYRANFTRAYERIIRARRGRYQG